MINIYHSRRGKFKRCEYWLRDEDERVGDLSEWIIGKEPKGFFYARPMSEKTSNASQISNVFMYDMDYITIETSDTTDLMRGAIVRYAGRCWMVDSIQRGMDLKETEYLEEYKTYIRLRK